MAKRINKLPVAKPASYAECSPVKPSKEQEMERRRYRAEDALRDMQRVEGYKQNKELMKDVKEVAAEQMRALSKIK